MGDRQLMPLKSINVRLQNNTPQNCIKEHGNLTLLLIIFFKIFLFIKY